MLQHAGEAVASKARPRKRKQVTESSSARKPGLRDRRVATAMISLLEVPTDLRAERLADFKRQVRSASGFEPGTWRFLQKVGVFLSAAADFSKARPIFGYIVRPEVDALLVADSREEAARVAERLAIHCAEYARNSVPVATRLANAATSLASDGLWTVIEPEQVCLPLP